MNGKGLSIRVDQGSTLWRRRGPREKALFHCFCATVPSAAVEKLRTTEWNGQHDSADSRFLPTHGQLSCCCWLLRLQRDAFPERPTPNAR
jgi:hypothetical protein